MDYGALLADSWKTVWKHKALLAFGLPSGLLLVEGLFIRLFAPDVWINLLSGTSSTEDVAQSLAILSAVLVTGVIASILVQVGVQTGVKAAVQGLNPIRFGAVLMQSVRYLWRILGAYVAVDMVFLFILVLSAGCQVVSALATAGLGALCTFPFLLLGSLLLAVSMDIATGLTGAAVIMDDLGLRAAFRQTWHLLRDRTSPVFVAGLVLSLILRFVPGLLAAPSLAASFLAALLASPDGAGTGAAEDIALVLQLGYQPFHLAALAVVEAFVYCGWSLAYLRLSRPPAPVPAA